MPKSQSSFFSAVIDILQTIESTLSFLCFMFVVVALLSSQTPPSGIDSSLYRLELAEDAWRVLYLRGALDDGVPSIGNDSERLAKVETELTTLGNATSLCFFFEGLRATNCRGEQQEMFITVHRIVIVGGKPIQVAFSIGK